MSSSMLLAPRSKTPASPNGEPTATAPQGAGNYPAPTETTTPHPTADSPSADWSLAQRVLFRFAFVYVLLYILQAIIDPFQDLWNAIVPWVGRLVFQLEVPILGLTGSGDTTFAYVQTFCCLVLAALAAAVWSVVDRKRAGYPRLWGLLRVSVRYFLAFVMIGYGVGKLTQFPEPSLSRLLQPFGEASPMGMLWTFMGASQGYTRFVGCVEILGGLLLTMRRTTLLGALVCVAALTQIVALNFFYDVPVKLFSSHLLALSILLTLPHLRRLADFFLFNRATQPAAERSAPGRRKWLSAGLLVFRALLVLGVFVGWQVQRELQYAAALNEEMAPSPLQGVWEVEQWTVDGQDQPLLVTNRTGWRRLVFDGQHLLAISCMDDSWQYRRIQFDTERHTVTLTAGRDAAQQVTWTYSEPEPGVLVLQGMEGRMVRIRLRKVDESRFLLKRRGFHWINEMPYNR